MVNDKPAQKVYTGPTKLSIQSKYPEYLKAREDSGVEVSYWIKKITIEEVLKRIREEKNLLRTKEDSRGTCLEICNTVTDL